MGALCRCTAGLGTPRPRAALLDTALLDTALLDTALLDTALLGTALLGMVGSGGARRESVGEGPADARVL